MKTIIHLILVLVIGSLHGQTLNNIVTINTTVGEVKCEIIDIDLNKIKIKLDNGQERTLIKEIVLSIDSKNYDDYLNNEYLKFPTKDGKIHYEEVVEVTASKNNLYSNAKMWFVDTFKSADDVIQMDDKELGVIIGKGFSDIYVDTKILGDISKTKTRAYYTIKVQLKENKYKVDIYDIYYYSYPTTGYYNSVLKSYQSGYPAVKSYPEEWFMIDSNTFNEDKIDYNLFGKNQKERIEISMKSYRKETYNLLNRLSFSIKESLNRTILIDDF